MANNRKQKDILRYARYLNCTSEGKRKKNFHLNIIKAFFLETWCSFKNVSVELGRSLSCTDSTILRCGSDHVIEVEESFYGRKTPHYCRTNMSASNSRATLPQHCSWIDVRDLVAGTGPHQQKSTKTKQKH